jgi:hypothetical protein
LWLAGDAALLAGLVNLDVAVVVAMPVALEAARRHDMPAGRLAVAVAITANAASFLLPTSNITSLLLLGSNPVSPLAYLRGSWLAWLLVVAVTVGLLSRWLAPAGTGPASRAGIRPSGRAALLLIPMFAAATRAILAGGITLRGGLAAQMIAGTALACAVNNLPAAAALRPGGTPGLWAAILATAIGPGLLITGSVATVICRRIARDSGATLRSWQYTGGVVGALDRSAVGGFGLFGQARSANLPRSLAGEARSRLVPRRLVGGDHHAGGRCDAVGKPQRHVHALWEQPSSGAEHQRVDHQHVLVDQVGSHQRADQHATAHDRQNAAGLRLERADCVSDVAAQQRRVEPRQRFGESGRRDVLGRVMPSWRTSRNPRASFDPRSVRTSPRFRVGHDGSVIVFKPTPAGIACRSSAAGGTAPACLCYVTDCS